MGTRADREAAISTAFSSSPKLQLNEVAIINIKRKDYPCIIRAQTSNDLTFLKTNLSVVSCMRYLGLFCFQWQ